MSYYFAAAGVVARLDDPARNTGEAAGDTYSGIENLYGSQSSDTLVGDAGSNRLTGWDGNDALWGWGGRDILDGGAGNDYLVGSAGSQTFIGGAGTDTVSYYFAAAGVVARLDQPARNTGEAVGDTYSGIENLYGSQSGDMLVGDAGSNRLTGWDGNDELWGWGGRDILDGGAGNDYLVGSAGSQTFIGGAGTDTVSYYFAAAGVVARLDQPALNTGEAAGDTYSGIENLYGSQSGDTLVGDAGSNRLTGWDGDDVLTGGGGGDILDGGAGHDSFVFNTTLGPANVDTITDFDPGNDRIVIDHATFQSLPPGACQPTPLWSELRRQMQTTASCTIRSQAGSAMTPTALAVRK